MDRERLNESDKDSDGRILPGALAHQRDDENSTAAKCKKYKWPIVIGVVVVFVVSLIIGLTAGKKDPEPTPPGPGPVPPGPTPDGFNPYEVQDIEEHVQYIKGNLIANQQTLNKLNAEKALKADAGKLEVDVRHIPQGDNNQMIKNVSFEFGQVGYYTALAKFTDAENDRWSIPESMVNKPDYDGTMRLDMCGFELMKKPFGFKFVDTRDKSNTILTTEDATFIMYDKYMQMDIKLPSQRMYGLGERRHEFILGEGAWTMWANGQETPYDDGVGGKQSYGVHPFVLVQTKNQGEYMGMFFRNSNAQSPIINHNDDGTTLFSYITTGGQIEVYFFFKGTAKQIISQYQQLIGKAQLPPFWALGWHAGSKAYSNQTLLEENIEGYKDNKFPLEGVWIDKDYMNGYSDFSVNSTAFPTIKTLTQTLQSEGKKMVLIVDAGLSSEDVTNPYYSEALQRNLLLKSSINKDKENGILTQHVWQNQTVFLDFFDENSKDVWGQGLRDLHDLTPYDGIWLDMNEATGFCNGECPDGENDQSASVLTREHVVKQKLNELIDIKNNTWYYEYTNQTLNSTYSLPFIAGKWNLDNMSMSLNATHPSDPTITEYNAHSLFGHSEGKMTYEILANETTTPSDLKDKRVFLLSRSTFSGSGQYVNHWLGDNQRTWQDMKSSIAGVMNMQMFGVPLVGPDTCGFSGEADQNELCARWVQLAQFYPFARQHGGGDKNEIWRMPEPYKTMAQESLFARLQYIRHMYTCMFRMHNEGYSCFDPLFFHYPNIDQNINTELTFIVGDALKVSPVLEHLEDGNKDYQVYFPNGVWVNMKNFGDIFRSSGISGGEFITLSAPDDSVNVHLMQGKIAIWQDNTNKSKSLTKEMLADQNIQLVINREQDFHADGRVFLDDGETISSLENGEYLYYDILHNKRSIIKQTMTEGYTDFLAAYKLQKIIITGAADLASVDTACYIDTIGVSHTLTPIYEASSQTLSIITNVAFMSFDRIHYLQKGQDHNLCDASTDFYTTDKIPDLSGAEASMDLTSTTFAARPITMNFTAHSDRDFIVRIRWSYTKQTIGVKVPFEVPEEIIDTSNVIPNGVLSDFVSITKDSTSGLVTVTVKDSNNMPGYTLNGFQLGELFNHIDGTVHTNKDHFKGIMGIFEQVTSDLWLKDGIYSLWSRDSADPVQTGKLPSSNTYGTHPFFMAKTQTDGQGDSAWMGVFYNLANAQDWRIKNDATTGDVSVKTYATGGIGDIFFMQGKKPSEITKAYQWIIGRPVMVPQWALGWNQCRWGYTDLDSLKEVVKNFSDYGLPLDTQWSDIDYLDRYRDFTYDKLNFNGLGNFVDDLHSKNMHYIPIIDAGIAKRGGEGYSVYDDGVANDVFIKNEDGSIFTGQVWPDDVAFPDFMNYDTLGWWSTQLSNFYNEVKFDGIWQDMNEASNFCNGVCYQNERSQYPVVNKLPYIPTGRNLETKSIALDAKHKNGWTELDTHSLYGTYEAKATNAWFVYQKQKRAMIISRSSFAGAGKFTSRWLGDNFAIPEYMGFSITGIMQQSIIGIPLAGADICGFMWNTTPELCARWYTVGAFYPFSRNHNGWGYDSQEPWVFDGTYEASVSYFDIIKKAMYTKFHMIRYYYTELQLTQSSGQGNLFQPLFFEFPDDTEALDAPQELNIMLGSALKLSVNSNTLNKNETDFYFPAGTWCNVFKAGGTDTCFKAATGENKTMRTKAYDAYVHIRENFIVPMQDGTKLGQTMNARTTKDLQAHPVDFHILPMCDSTSCKAAGRNCNDDGETLELASNENYQKLTYSHDVSGTDAPAVLLLTLSDVVKARNFDNNIVNKNDVLGQLVIYNAAAMNMASNSYLVEVTLATGTVVSFNEAKYNVQWDRLEFVNSSENEIELPNIIKIEFAIKV